MSIYSINDLERLTSLKAHTIRTWELRYDLLQPKRTDTNIRYYDDEQLKKLLNVCELIGMGMKISKISKLTSKEVETEIDKLIASLNNQNAYVSSLISQSLIAASTYNEELFNVTFSNALAKLGMVRTYLEVIYPMLVRTGLMWTKSELLPAQEHFLTSLIRQKLYSAIEHLPSPQKTDQTWILFLKDEEQHEIGLLFASYILKQKGVKVIYLGENVPHENLKAVVSHCKATYLYTFITKNLPKEEIERYLSKLSADFKKVKVCFSGRADLIETTSLRKNIICIKDVETLISLTE